MRNTGELNIINRPMTQQGLGGVKLASQGPGRMVMDRTFFLSELRQKIGLLSGELKRLSAEAEAAEAENSNYLAFEKRADSLADELREQQGRLGDLNTLVDKLHTDSDLEDIERQHAEIKAQNQRESHNVDDVFLIKQQKENSVRDLERQIEDEKRKAESLVNNLPPQQRQEYHELKRENEVKVLEIQRRQSEMDELNIKLRSLHEKLSKNPSKRKAFSLKTELQNVQEKKREQEEAAKKSAAAEENIPEERERLLARVKEDNQEIAGMERKVVEVEDQIRRLRGQISQIDSDLEAHQGERNAKYEELLKRDKDMQMFIDAFEERRDQATEKKASLEDNIEQYLERIKLLGKQDTANTAPNVEKYNQLQGDLQFKEKEMANSQNTVEAMIIERDRRLADLDKVRQLEGKLANELSILREKISTLNADLNRVNNLDEVKLNAELSKKRNLADSEALKLQREALRQTLRDLNAKYDEKKNQLHDNETYSHLGALEQRLKHQESTNFHLREFVLEKKSESDYNSVADEVSRLMEEANGQIIKIMGMLPVR